MVGATSVAGFAALSGRRWTGSGVALFGVRPLVKQLVRLHQPLPDEKAEVGTTAELLPAAETGLVGKRIN